jgi:predicted phage-related endonuclease
MSEVKNLSDYVCSNFISMFGDEFSVLKCKDEKEWLERRRQYICGSEAADIIGCGFKSNIDVYKDKTGSGIQMHFNPEMEKIMQKGSDSEIDILRLYGIDHDVEVISGTRCLCINNRILTSTKQVPFIACTLDGIALYDKEPTIIEIKRSTSPNIYKDNINPPIKYRAQVLHQMLVTGIKKAVLVARVVWFDSDNNRRVTEKEYKFNADDDDVRNDMNGLLCAETAFWHNNVLLNVEPPMIKHFNF